MGWAVGYDSNHSRDVGYGVPAYCDHPGCGKVIDRGLAYVCGGDMYGGDHGCGLFFCYEHLMMAGNRRNGAQLCQRCYTNRGKQFDPTPDHPDWINHKWTDPSWEPWRQENAEEVEKMKRSIKKP